MEETTTDRALEAAAAAARAVIEEELGEDASIALLFAITTDAPAEGEDGNASVLAAAANMVEKGYALPPTFGGLVMAAIGGARAAGADVRAFPITPPNDN